MMVTPGIAYFGDNQLLLDTNMMVDKVEELNDFPIRAEPGNSVYLRDIGHAEDSYAIQTSRVRIDGRPAGLRAHLSPAGASSLAVVNGVKDHLQYIEDRCPPGTKLKFVMDQSIYVKEAIRSLIEEGVDRRRPGLDHDPDLPRQLAHDADRQHVDPAGDPGRDHRPVRDRQHHQRHDAGRPGAGHRPAGRRRHRRAGEQPPQLQPGQDRASGRPWTAVPR